ncbi:hypothetical protein FQA39_LY16481 [Lamprigera yunnana]|nr:hypothetical protein FQA39_LY16481 [Lamprigera yunnana]
MPAVSFQSKIMSCGLPDAGIEALDNMSDSHKDFEVSEQDDHISGNENDYNNSDSEADNEGHHQETSI